MSVQFYCERCGGLFNSIRASKRFCDDCNKAKLQEYNSEYYKRQRAIKYATDGTLDRLRIRIMKAEVALGRLKARARYIEQAWKAEGRQV